MCASKESIIRVREGKKNLSLVITTCHHSASLLMPIGDPQDGFFYPTRTLSLMMDSYIPNMTLAVSRTKIGRHC